jgi:hypothetical protein
MVIKDNTTRATMAKIGIPGILEVDQETGIIVFHADPRYVLCKEQTILRISGLPTPIPDPTAVVLDVQHMTGQNWQAITRDLSTTGVNTTDLARLSDDVERSTELITTNHGYAGVLYPEGVPQIMASVLAGTWKGQNPETVIDWLIFDWLKKRVPDIGGQAAYLAQLIGAVKNLNCGDIVLARLNAAVLEPVDQGDTIIIKRDRCFLLPGECVQPDHPLSGMPRLSTDAYDDENLGTKDLYTNSFTVAERFYANEQVVQTRPPAPTLPTDMRDLLRKHLGQHGTTDHGAAMERLEQMLHGRNPEHNIIARLCYLAVFNVLTTVNGRALLTRLLPLLTSTQKQLSE